MRSILGRATLMTDDQVERVMKGNPVADGDDSKQLETQCIGARDIVSIKPFDSGRGTAIVSASLPARGFRRLGMSALGV